MDDDPRLPPSCPISMRCRGDGNSTFSCFFDYKFSEFPSLTTTNWSVSGSRTPCWSSYRQVDLSGAGGLTCAYKYPLNQRWVLLLFCLQLTSLVNDLLFEGVA